jgi:hypothetical protein
MWWWLPKKARHILGWHILVWHILGWHLCSNAVAMRIRHSSPFSVLLFPFPSAYAQATFHDYDSVCCLGLLPLLSLPDTGYSPLGGLGEATVALVDATVALVDGSKCADSALGGSRLQLSFTSLGAAFLVVIHHRMSAHVTSNTFKFQALL